MLHVSPRRSINVMQQAQSAQAWLVGGGCKITTKGHQQHARQTQTQDARKCVTTLINSRGDARTRETDRSGVKLATTACPEKVRFLSGFGGFASCLEMRQKI